MPHSADAPAAAQTGTREAIVNLSIGVVPLAKLSATERFDRIAGRR
jgi:hypothetical protein